MKRIQVDVAKDSPTIPTRVGRAAGPWVRTLLVTAAFAGLIGCTTQQSPPATESATSNGSEPIAEATSVIALNWDPQDSCVTFVPKSATIHVGDRVNFNTSMNGTVTVNIPAGLFSAGDTTITVTRGPNTTSPTAQSAGTYPLTSSPRACATPDAGGGPSIIVITGEPTTKP